MACERVHKRVSEGGHDIPKDTIFRRYWLGLENLFRIFMPIIDYWALYDNNNETSIIANSHQIIDKTLYTKIQNSICQRKKR